MIGTMENECIAFVIVHEELGVGATAAAAALSSKFYVSCASLITDVIHIL